MVDVNLALSWRVDHNGKRYDIDPLLVSLLRGIGHQGQLKSVSEANDVSYRHAWGLIRTWEQRFTTALLISQPGRGTALTTFAEDFLRIYDQTLADHRVELEQSSLKISAAIASILENERRRVRIVSSHDDKLYDLRDQLKHHEKSVTLQFVGSEAALRQFRSGDADVAGFHLPIGELGLNVGARLIKFLDDATDEIFLVQQRMLGLVSSPAKPCTSIKQLVEDKVKFINRQVGSTTRLTFDALLDTSGIASSDVMGYQDEEYTHTAVAALIASANAGAGFGSKASAQSFDLFFEPLVTERFYLCVHRALGSAMRQQIAGFCSALTFENRDLMKDDELRPSVAVLKRVHRAGFWK